MIKDILEEKGLSVYKVSKETNISYSTLSDIVLEKTDIKKSSAELLYRLSKYLNVSMETLYTSNDNIINNIYIHNSGRNIIVETKQCRHQYLGPKNLISLMKINKVEGNVVYVEAVYRDGQCGFIAEEEYIDLQDVLNEDQKLLDYKYSVLIGSATKLTKEKLINESLLVSDNMSIKMYFMPDSVEPMLEVRNMTRVNYKAIIRLKDYAIVETNMSIPMQKRAVDAVRRNNELLMKEGVVMYNYA